MTESLFHALKSITSSRKSIRAFDSAPLTREDIDKIISIAQTAPYASGRKNWSIMVITDRAIIKEAATIVAKQAEQLTHHMRDDFAGSFSRYAHSFTAFASAPALFIPWFRVAPTVSIMVNNSLEDIAIWERDTFVKSISCVTMLITLAAESLGLGSCINTGSLIAEKELIKLFNIKPGRSIGAIIPVGYKGEK